MKVPEKETMRRGKEGWEKKRVELEKGGDGTTCWAGGSGEDRRRDVSS